MKGVWVHVNQTKDTLHISCLLTHLELLLLDHILMDSVVMKLINACILLYSTCGEHLSITDIRPVCDCWSFFIKGGVPISEVVLYTVAGTMYSITDIDRPNF